MEEKVKFITFLFEDLRKNMEKHMKNRKKSPENSYYCSESYGNKDHGKAALKRKITYLRQELLNLERMVEE